MQEIEAYQDLFGQNSAQMHWDLNNCQTNKHTRKKTYSFVIIALDHLQQIHSQNFKHHAEVVAIGSLVNEGVEKLNHMTIIPRV